MALLCNVTWAQTSYFKMGTSTTSLSDGNYVLVAMSDKGTGPVIYDPDAGEGKHYRYEAGKTLAADYVVPSKYVWTIDETTVDGVQHITVTNYDDNTKAFPADESRNQNFTGSGVASLLTEVKTIGETNYIALSRDIVVEGNTAQGYVHANAPSGNPCLSYWDGYGDNGSCVKFTFYPVEALTDAELADRLTYNISDGNYNNRTDNSSSSWRPGWTSTNVGKPSFTITAANNKNNMNAGSTEFIGMRPGDTKSCVYTLTLGERFTGYSFEAKSNNASPAHVITINGKETTISSTEWTTISADVIGTTSSFQLTGSNNQDLYIRNIKFVQDAEVFASIEAAVTANANMDIYGLQRYLGLVQNADKYECNYPSNPADGQGYPALIDGNYDTYFHSGYDSHNPGPDGVAHYLQADLGKKAKSFRFYFKKRKQNNANRPTKITIEGSNDKETWAPVTVIASGFPTDQNVLDYYSEAITSETAYQYYRFTVNTTSGGTRFFTFSEFYILPTYAKVNETFDAVRNYRAGATATTVAALNEAYVWNTGLTKGTPIVGADHFFFADTKQSDNSYVARYLYNNNGALATSTSLDAKDAKFIWTAAQPEGTEYYTLQNKGDNTKYISYGNNGNGIWVGATAVQLDIKSSYAVHSGSVGIQRVRPSGDSNGAWMVTAADGSSFNRNSGKVNNGSWCSDYVFIPADLYEGLNALTIVSNTSKANAVFTWNENETVAGSPILFFSSDGVADGTLRVKSCNPTYKLEGFYSDAAYTQKITEVTELPADMTVYAKFVLDIFSATYGEKWVRLQNCSNTSYLAATYDAIGKTAILNYADENQLWCLVGTAESFVLYNKSTGDKKALKVTAATYSNGSEATIESDLTATWKLKAQNFGYALVPTHNTNNSELGINMYGGPGGALKLYGTAESNTGSYWMVEMVDVENPLALSVAVTGEQPYATTNTRVADLNTTINGATSSTVVKGNVGALTYYLPVGATFTLNNNYIYRGYIFEGFLDAEGNAAEYTNATIPEGGLNITAKYSVDEDNKYQYLFYYRDDVHNKPYRIPTIATASNNTVLAFSDYRPCSNDIGYGEVDIMLRRSYDNGKTWSEAVCIADGQGGNSNVFNVGFGDAAVVADRESGKVLVMAVAGKQVFAYGSSTGHNSMAKIVSNDNGESWNDPEDVTSQFMIAGNSLFPEAHTMFFGSGRMLQSRVYKAEGADYYRIYGALLIKHPSSTYTGNCNYVVYSDDFGATWKILGGSIDAGMCCNGGDEPKVEELPDGSIVLSSRKYYGRYFNVFTYTDKATGAGAWGSVVASHDQTGGISFGGNATNGEIYKVKAIHNESGRICDVMLQSIPIGGGRSNVSVYFKEMSYAEAYTPTTFAQNWTKGLEVSEMGSAYSTMILQADGNFGFFYEELPGDNYAYCMVYVPLSLEELTNDAYSLYTVNSTIGEYKIGTFYASEAVQIPEGVKAYVATEEPVMENGAGVITMTELEGIIPAHTGAVLRGDAATYKFIPSISYGAAVKDNMLVGFEAADNDADSKKAVTVAEDYTTYVLTVQNEKAGFYRKEKGSTFNVGNNKAYLQVPAAVSANALRIRIEGEQDDYATEIVMPVANGQQSTAIYDLTGRRVQKVQKGLYIVNGKKVLK